ncbi:MAG: TrkH family potassium uptake protein [Erysipelotrichaceae bacterium]|nr:TrkH family potassium uptake protein [Erysipelotrichaceae bacterium]
MINKYHRLIAYYLAIFIIMVGIIQFLPLIVLPFYPDEVSYAWCFLVPGAVAIGVGWLIRYLLRDTEIVKLEKHYDAVLVVLVWLTAILISTVPWMLKGDYNFSQAAFEMTSGYSTTGLTVVDTDNTPHVFLMFRSISLFVGGVGLVLILTCAFSDKYGLNLYNAEGHNDRLMPNLAKSAQLILSIYTVYIIAGTVAYVLLGMPLFDAINTAIAALSTGGFSVINESIYGYHSLGIEIVSMILMLLGMTNFMLHLSFLKKRFGNIWKHSETKFFVAVVAIIIPLMCYDMLKSGFAANFGESLRYSLFQFVTCITTTGFVSVKSLAILPSGFITLMILLMLFGGDLESTGGGIKQYRIIVTLKGIYRSIKNTILNRKMVTTDFIERVGKRYELTQSEISSTSSYVLFYLILLFAGSFIFTLEGYSLQDSMFEFCSAVCTVGLSVGITGYHASKLILWTANVGMFLGRLEIMVVFEAILRLFKDFRERERN